MEYSKAILPDRLLRDIIESARKTSVEKVILFGSRARRTNSERSDVDLAVKGGDFDGFYREITENSYSLLMFDIVNLSSGISEELQKEIDKDGVLLYEKV
ncbi:MAG: nucleotidyltransferase domain-containing protein [Saccharofermentans sp.]|nr:nucleotidyltransferase domain-containing protein [Saccharofermentans sp.]